MNKFLFNRFNLIPMMEESGEGTSGGSGSSGEGNDPKTFTQEDLNRIAAQEKRQGASSVLKNLGFEDEETAKAFIEKYRQEEDDKKDALAKAQEDLQSANTAKTQAEQKAENLERKFQAIEAGVSAKNADDVVLLATAKVVDGKTFKDALEEVKTAHPTLFETTEQNQGTGGNSSSHNRRQNSQESESIGKRLAEKRNNESEAHKKKSYFSN